VKGNREVADAAKVISLFLLNAHLQKLLSTRCVNQKVATSVHSCRWEVDGALIFEVPVPLFVFLINSERHVTLQHFEGISRLVRGLVVTEAALGVTDDEVFIF